jgi:branched-chain amino acid transport system ATP-binding protein
MLAVENVSKKFGGQVALDGVNLVVPDRKVTSLIGPNGSGKSTLFNVINGIYAPSSGQVLLSGEDITCLPPHKIAKRGISRTFQMTRIFLNLTVLENLLVAEHTHVQSNFWQNALNLPSARREEIVLRKRAREILDFVGLGAFADMRSAELSIGQRRLLQVGMALLGGRKLLMLDEPAAGLSPPNAEKLISLITSIRDEWGVTILLVEHAMSVVMAVSDRVAVLNFGRMIAVGTPTEVRANKSVIEAYLGERNA